MERIEGLDLEEYQQQRQYHPIDQHLALEWLLQLAEILDAVHQQQFFHRDIKPSNIILYLQGKTNELADFIDNGNSTYGSAPNGESLATTTPVGSFQVANAFGLYDMHGNVEEWCEDHWHENYDGAPTDGSAWVEDNDYYLRLLRGGSWSSGLAQCRSACRNYFYPDNWLGSFISFRVLCEAA